MSFNVTTHFVQQYTTNVQLLLQQKGSKLRGTVSTGSYSGKAAKAVELAAYLRSEGAPLSPPSPPSTSSPPSTLGDGSEASVARAILALALWRVTEAEAAGGGDQPLSSLRGQRSRNSLLSILSF